MGGAFGGIDVVCFNLVGGLAIGAQCDPACTGAFSV